MAASSSVVPPLIREDDPTLVRTGEDDPTSLKPIKRPSLEDDCVVKLLNNRTFNEDAFLH